MAFGIQYSVNLLGGAVADMVGDPIRRRDYTLFGATISGVRMIIVCSLVAIVTELVVAACFIHDVEVAEDDAEGVDEGGKAYSTPGAQPRAPATARVATREVQRPQAA